MPITAEDYVKGSLMFLFMKPFTEDMHVSTANVPIVWTSAEGAEDPSACMAIVSNADKGATGDGDLKDDPQSTVPIVWTTNEGA